MSHEITLDRRRCLTSLVTAVAAAKLGMMHPTHAQSTSAAPAEPRRAGKGSDVSFGPLQQIDAGVLNVGYREPASYLRPAQ